MWDGSANLLQRDDEAEEGALGDPPSPSAFAATSSSVLHATHVQRDEVLAPGAEWLRREGLCARPSALLGALLFLAFAAATLLAPASHPPALEDGAWSAEEFIELGDENLPESTVAADELWAEPSKPNLRVMEDTSHLHAPWICWEKDWRKDAYATRGDGFEYSDTLCPKACKAFCRRPSTNAICSDNTSAEEMKEAEAALKQLRANYTSADWCIASVPKASVSQLMAEFQRVDALLQAIAGGPGGHISHCYPGNPLKKKMSHWYCGPFLENHWIDKYYRREFLCSPLNYVKTFGPFVPIFVQWVDTWVLQKFRYTPLIHALTAALQPGKFVYTTMAQNAQGVAAPVWDKEKGIDMNGIDMHGLAAKGLLSFSAGGMGQVPIPLLKQPEVPLRGDPPENLKFKPRLLGFAGTIVKRGPRPELFKKLKASPDLKPGELGTYHGPDWRWFHTTSKYCLAPRGFGRTSFTLFETIQLEACVPVYLYDDFLWLPYLDDPKKPIEIRDGWVIAANISHVADLPKFVRNISEEAYKNMTGKLQRMLASHFTYDGVLEQVKEYLSKEKNSSDLKCRLPMPSTNH